MSHAAKTRRQRGKCGAGLKEARTWDEEIEMKHKLALVSLGAALALAAAAAGAQAAPTGNLGGVRAADTSKLTHAVHGDYDRGHRSWYRRYGWDNDHGRRGHNRWWRHRRHHDHDRWSWDGGRRHHHHHHRDRDRRW
jgi:hypothetical protein